MSVSARLCRGSGRAAAGTSCCGSTSSCGAVVTQAVALGSTPTTAMRSPRTSTVLEPSRKSTACSRSRSSAARENGSRVTATSWFPSTTKGRRSWARSERRRASPRGCETRSPVTHTISGSRAATHATARSDARLPRDNLAPKMEVGQVSDPDSVERGGKSLNGHFDDARPQPARLDPPVGDDHDGNTDDDEDEGRGHTGTLEVGCGTH